MMKHSKTVFLLPAVVVLCSACGSGDQGATPPAPPPPDTVQVAPPAPADPVAFAAIEAPDQAVATKIRCALDSVNGQRANGQTIALEAGAAVQFRGWVSDVHRNAPATFSIVLSGPATYAAEGGTGIKRADVARSVKAPGLMDSGFDVATLLGPVEAGDYEVALVVTDGDGAGRCQTTARLAVAAAPGG